ncbi:MAG: NAD(P)/FAD-dependent oxidoreductase [Christensenellaceae bacterium]|jgi:predicted Rossmann fold flavoprotein|nr:NAD(P)/FAD-dependent oxidoreductase [Christensenellaceae bacterium]
MESKNKKYSVCIIGGGASGLFAAANLLKKGLSVVVCERNAKVGRKLYITGKGRANITNACPANEFIENVVNGKKFLRSAIYSFPPEKTEEFFENAGVRLKTERGNRVFPQSDKAADIIDALLKACKGADFLFETRALRFRISENEDSDLPKVIALETDKCDIFADSYIIATGGVSYPLTGSTGDGYRLTCELPLIQKYEIVPPRAALCPLLSKDSSAELYPVGLSLKNVACAVFKSERDNKPVARDEGEMLFTDKGVSGPIILTLSSLINREAFPLVLSLDLKPALTREVLDARLLRDFELYKNKELKNALDDLLPRSLIPYLIFRTGIPPEKPVNSITKEERKKLLSALKGLTFTITSPAPLSEAIITSGGITLTQVDPKTMRGKLTDNLYFIGEVLDVDALTGGFNLQIAFSTAVAAITAIAQR